MSKQIQVNLAFNADTAKAKQQINDLVNSLNQISNKNTQIFDDREFREAANAARDLTKHLEAAVNVNTGKLDLNKFSQSLSQSKQSLSDLYNSLSKAGPQGQQAFLQLASSIASSESQVLNLNAKVKDLGVTLKNTVKWQLSSSLVHGFMGALQHAFGYAQDLNSSLNDIRIVTGASAEEMAKFAEQANKSAKALSSTTNEYAKASLIYYQQGLSDSEVKERTDVTIKMANVSKESAQVVSDQMTAVWNNFYDGSKSLEYYADVMTALGAATASSVDEIAGGLEKFAAIGDTIGLSYEYAASALATITSNTRQSEEVVGTALKTIFARIQGLNLGETLDDGTTLNKYSAALDKVGISIFDQAGELKNMDNILSEMGNKWQELSKDQQIALAQTVAGTRQYTQLVALMDNWDNGDSDSFQANLSTAYGSEGALQEQQDIYAESWEAAADRVKAATEDIYDSLLNDEAIISILNGLENILSLVGSLIDGFGGLKGIILLVGATFAKSFAKEVPDAVNKIKTNLKIISGQAEKEKQKNVQDAKDIITSNKDSFKNGNFTRANATTEELESLLKLEAARDRLSDSQYEYLRGKIAEKKASKEAIAVKEDEIAQLEKEYQLKQKQNIKASSKKESKGTPISKQLKLEEESDILEARKTSLEQGRDKLLAKVQKGDTLSIKQAEDLDNYDQELQAIEKRNAALQESINLEKQRQEIISKESLDIKNDDGESIGIDHKAYEAAISERTQKLQNAYQKQAASRLVLEDYDKQISSWTSSAGSMKIKNLGADEQKKEVDKLKQSVIKYAEELNKANNIEFTDDKLKDLKDSLKDIETNAGEVIDKFKEFASVTQVDKATAALEETTQEVQQLQEELKALTPDGFDKIDAEAREAAENIATAQHKLQQLENSSNQIDVDIDVDASNLASTLTDIGSLAMDTAALFTELGVIISTVFDSNATLGEKLTATITGLGSMALTSMQIFSTLANPGFLAGLKDIGGLLTNTAAKGSLLSGVLGKLGAGFTTAGGGAAAATLAFGKILLVIGLVIGAIKLLTWLFDTFSPEGKLEAVKQTTEAMATAANDANTAYQNLLNTLSGYNSAISALEGLEAGTQEFTNALITANEKAWELIDTYGLIQGQDWDYDNNGAIVIKQSAQDRIIQETNDIREDAVIAHSVAQVQEKEAAYNVSRSNAGMVGYDIQQGYLDQNVLYDALGLTDGSFKHTKNAIQQWQEEGIFNADVADKIAQSLYGVDWLDLDSSQLEYINNNIFKYLDEIETMFGDFSQYNSAKENQFDKQVSTIMSDEEAYQKTSWKGAVNDYLESSFESTKQEALAEYEGKTDDQINAAYEDYLKKTYIEEDGKYYRKDASGNKTGEAIEGLTGLSPEAQKDILATVDAWQVLEDKGVEMAQSFNGIANDMTDSEKDVANALLNGDFNSLTEEQIEAFKSGELSLEEAIGSSNYQQLATLLGEDYIQQLENGFKEAVNNWQPPEFDLESWKSDYNIIKDLKIGDTIDPEKWNQLDANMQQFFDKTIEGEYRLTVAADDLLNKLNDEIETEIESQQKQIEMGERAGGKYYNDIGKSALSNNVTEGSYNKDIVQAQLDFLKSQGKDTSQYTEKLFDENGNFKTVKGEDVGVFDELAEAAANAKLELNTLNESLNSNQAISATASTSVDELRNKLNDGTIDLQEYNDAFDNILITEAKSEDLDYESILNYAEYLSENAESLEDVDDALQGNLNTAKKVALVQAKLNKAIQILSDNWEDWNKAIKKGDMSELQHKLPAINDAIKDMLDLTDEAFEGLSDDFAIKNWDTIKDVVNGVEGALEKLQVEAAKDYAINLGLSESQITEEMTSLMSELTLMAEGTELTVEPGIDNANAFDGLYELLTEAGFTADQIADIFDKLGWDPQIEYKEMTVSEAQKYTGGGYQTVLVPTDDGGWEEKSINLSAENDIAGLNTVKVPVIKGTKTSGGSGSYTPKNTSSRGGGGGGQKKHAEKKSSSEKTRYHTIQNQLEDLKDEYDEISDAADRAFGQDKLDAIDDQIDKTDELIDKQEEYLDAISENLPKDKAIMDAYYDEVIGGPKIEYDERGNIANFDEIQEAMFAKYNEMAGSLTNDSEAWQQFEKQYEKLEKYIEQYEETYDLLREEEAAYQELLNQRLDLQLEKVQYGVELNLNINEDDLSILEFQLSLLEDKAFESANRIALSTKQASNLYDQILVNQKGLEDALGLSLSPAEIAKMMQGDMSVLEGKTFTEDQIDAIKDYRDNLLDLNNDLIEIQKQVEEEVLAAFDEWHEELDKGMDKFDHYSDVLDNYKNIIDIVGKDVLGLDNENIAKLSEAQVNNSINRLRANKDAYEAYQKSATEAEEKMKAAQENAAAARAAGNEELAKSYDEDAEFWKETSEEMNESAREAQEELMNNWGNTLEAIVTQFEEAVERAIEAFNDAIYELGGLEGLSADFSRAKEDDDTYLDDYQKIYELSKLTRDINNKIDDTDNIAGKQKLKALLEDINKLQEDGVEMSQYDLEYLQATYDLRLAELELEEARNAKNTVRLQKDNEGNWSYVYTQNTDAVDSAQQKYEDALYAMQDLSTNYIDEMSEKLISTSQEMQEALAAVRVEDYASIEEYYAELDRIERLYTERMSKQQAELQKGLDNNKTLYNTDWLNYSEATGYKISKAEEFAQAFSNTMLGQLTNTDTVDAFGQLITSATTTLVSGLTTAATTYYQNIGLATEAAGSSITDFADLLEEDIEAIKSKSGEAASSVEDMATRMDTAMTDIINKVAEWQEEYGREIDKIIRKNLLVIETYNNMIKALSGASGKITISYDVDSTTSTPVDVGTTVPEGTAQAATGGYTGNWGSNEGKLAILHQRELILNELDTSNFLQALEITRQIMSVIDIQAKQASLGLGAITASTLKDEKPKETLEQEVHITAEFPNVNNHYEIEEAFNTLINTASQYANRK